ncbi:hypothetical protein [Miniphocaeibacter massiliensis]|uniref:hypothetical protein n=1 Tax=Miniphocaeibacter massiliensis TaxID=2041841 RepID=UPI000C1BE5DD|nr:hypothetical protein [Miniphocaeibacter massiliensis]
MKEKLINFLRILGIILLVLTIIIAIIIYYEEYRVVTIDEKHNEEKSIYFQEIGKSFLVGPSEIQIVFENDRVKTLKKMRLSNGGILLSENNWKVLWDKEYALITLKGHEQIENKFKIYYKDGKFEEIKSTIYRNKPSISPEEETNSEKAEQEEQKKLEKIKVEDKDKELSEQYIKVFNYLKEQGEKVTDTEEFDYTAKGQLYMIVYNENEKNTGKPHTKRLIYNENFFEENKTEFVYYESVNSSSEDDIQEEKILGFYILDEITGEVVKENRTGW